MPETIQKPRRVWLALLLSLLGCPLGHVYCGYFRRAFNFWLVGTILLPAVAFCCVTFRLSQAGYVAIGLAILCFPVIQTIDAIRLARRRPTIAKKFYQRWWVYLGIYFLCYLSNFADAYLTKTYIAEVFKITSRSMAPTILEGDLILVDKFWTSAKRMARNDIVVYHNVEDESLHVMRAVALAGDKVQISDDEFLLNGVKAIVPNAHYDAEPPPNGVPSRHNNTNVPSFSFFVLGDNRNMALDSCYVGPIPTHRLYGTAVNVVWSRPIVLPEPYGPRPDVPAKIGPIAWWRIGLPLR